MNSHRNFLIVVFLICLAFVATTTIALGQSNRGAQDPVKKSNKRPLAPQPGGTPPPLEEDITEVDGVISIDTNLVTIPVKVVDRNGRFVGGLKKSDFTVFENKEPQELAYFSNEEMPFTVALVLDMSYSSVFKVNEIQQAALQFVTELRPKDKVTVIAFSHEVEVLCEPTGDRKTINNAILRTQIGSGTSVYEAVDYALNKLLSKVTDRKAVVLFSDGVDTTSRMASDRENLRDALESETIFYPIRYDTYADVQRVQNQKVTIIDQSRPQTTAPIGGGSIPGSSSPLPFPIPTGTIGSSGPVRSMPGDGTSIEEYKHAEEYLNELASRTGGRIYLADTRTSLASAFSKIASELREFYSLGYYPPDDSDDTKRRSIRVRVNMEKVSVRARDSYVFKPRVKN